MICNALMAATVLVAGPAVADPSFLPSNATALQVAASLPAGISAEARNRIEMLLSHADTAESQGDHVFFRTWLRLAQQEIAEASVQTAEVR